MYEVATIAPGVKRTELSWGYYLEGKKEALIASGLAEPSWFADRSQRNKRGQIVRSKKLIVDGRKVQTTWPQIGPTTVIFHYTEAERQAHEEKETFLLCLERRLTGCASVIHSAADDIRDKHEKHPMERPQDLRGSSKLGRALHELDIARRNIDAVVKKLSAAVGPDDQVYEEDDE